MIARDDTSPFLMPRNKLPILKSCAAFSWGSYRQGLPPLWRCVFFVMRKPAEKSQKGKRYRTVPSAKKVFLIGIFVIAQVIFLSSDFFKLRTVEVTGSERISQEEFMKTIKVPWGSNIAFLSLEPFRSRLEKMLWVKGVQVKKIYPGGLKIQVKERNPVICAASAGDMETWYSIDEEGVVLGLLSQDSKAELPHLVMSQDMKVGGKIEGAKVGTILTFLTYLSPETNRSIKDYMIEGDSQLSFRYLCGEKLIGVKLGKLENIEEKMGVFQKILNQMEGKTKNLEYIDLRYTEPVVKMSEAGVEEKKEGE
jgi:cell division septal protein FtsQ